ncbi:MAG TPA: hypothetical protein VGL60_03780 [Acidimicrobiales bacterium]
MSDEELAEPTDEGSRRVLERYMAAFEQSDMATIERLLVDDAILEMTGTSTWFSGKATCVPFIAAQAIGQAGDWRMVPLRVNGQLAVAAYHLDGDDAYRPFAIVVLASDHDPPHPHLAVRRARALRPLRRTQGPPEARRTRDWLLTRHLSALCRPSRRGWSVNSIEHHYNQEEVRRR